MLRLVIVTLTAALGGCAVTQTEEAPKVPLEPTKMGFELDQGALEANAEPLPDKQNIHAIWHYTDGKSQRVLAYRGWDFNKDGRIDMLEVLALDGTPEAMAFDFDGDGTIDMLKKREKNEFDISQAVNMPDAPPASVVAH